MKLADQIQTSMACYFAYCGARMAQILSKMEFSKQKEIAQTFFDVVTDELYDVQEDGQIKITIPLAKDIEEALCWFLGVYEHDKRLEEQLDTMEDVLTK